VRNFILGGMMGNSTGNVNRALRKPPSLIAACEHRSEEIHSRHTLNSIGWPVHVYVIRTTHPRQLANTHPMIKTSHSYRLFSSTRPATRPLVRHCILRGLKRASSRSQDPGRLTSRETLNWFLGELHELPTKMQVRRIGCCRHDGGCVNMRPSS
jgi:hypothetical protein